jgi:hypothetical protein
MGGRNAEKREDSRKTPKIDQISGARPENAIIRRALAK